MSDDQLLPQDLNAQVMVHWLGGIVFSLLLSLLLLFVAPHIPGLGGVLFDIEKHGLDAAVRMNASLEPPSVLGLDASGYVFLDIDSSACSGFASDSRCFSRSPAAPGLAAQVAAAAITALPRVLIVDVPLWGQESTSMSAKAGLQHLDQVMQAHPGVPVVAVAPFRPNGPRRHGVVDWSALPSVLSLTNLRYAPAVVWQSRSDDDDVLRTYPASVKAQEIGNGKIETLPTLPYIAALYVIAGHDLSAIQALNCTYPTFVRSKLCDPRQSRNDPAISLLAAATSADKGRRMYFAIPSLAPDSSDRRPVHAAEFQGFYDRYSVSSSVTKSGALLLDQNLLRDKIVIISTSAPLALDHHQTPLGEMTGAEVILNGVHAFLGDLFVIPQGIWTRLLHELEITGVSSLPWLGFWFFQTRASVLRPGTFLGRIALGMALAAAYLLALSVAMAFAALTIFGVHASKAGAGVGLEFFTPIFAMALEGFADGARWLIDEIGDIVEEQLVRIMHFIRR